MKRAIALFVLPGMFLFAAVFAAAGDHGSKTAKPAHETRQAREVRGTELAFAAAARAKDFDKFMTFWDDDVHFFNQGKMLTGREEERKNWQFLKDPNVSITWSPEVVEASGGMGYTTGPYEIHIKQKDGSEKVEHGRYVTIWHRKAEGKWKAALDIGSPEPPAEKKSQ